VKKLIFIALFFLILACGTETAQQRSGMTEQEEMRIRNRCMNGLDQALFFAKAQDQKQREEVREQFFAKNPQCKR
jgi:hypothetical protein